MLQAPSHLSRVCGHSHYKKFWLMQMQNESQANVGCEKNGNLATSTSRCMPSTPISSDSNKNGSCWGTGAPSMRTLLRGGTSTRGPNSANGTSKHVSLVTCAESVSPPLQADLIHRSSHHSLTSLNVNELKDDNIDERGNHFSNEEEEGRSLPGSPTANGSDLSATSSSCGSPFRDSNRALSSADVAEKTDFYDRLKPYPDEFRITARRKTHAGDSGDVPGMNEYATAAKSERLTETLPEKYTLDSIDGSSTPAKGSDPGIFPCKDGADSGGLRSPAGSSKFLGERGLLLIHDFRSPDRTLMHTASDRSQGKNMAPDEDDDDDDDEDDDDCCEDALPEDGKSQDLNKCESNIGRNSLRTCSHCGTTKTPLWRSGPHGPKSLCNACGIRFKKSRRCLGSVAEGFDSHGSPPVTPNSSRFLSRSMKRKQESATYSQLAWSQDEGARSAVKGHGNFHKRSRWTVAVSLKRNNSIGQQGEDPTGSSGESCLTWNLHSPSSVSLSPWKGSLQDGNASKSANAEKINVTRIFARDEDEEAAVLLMALSYGLVNA